MRSTFRRSLRFLFFHSFLFQQKLFAFLIPFLFRHLRLSLYPRIAIVFSLLSRVPNTPCYIYLFSRFPLTHPVLPCILHILPLCETYIFLLLCHKAILLIFFLLFSTTGACTPLLSGRSRSPRRNRSFNVLA